MKYMKHFRFLIIAALAAVLGACQAEPADNERPSVTGKEVRIVASIEGSRVATDVDMIKSSFQNGDRIALDVIRRPIYQVNEPAIPTYELRDNKEYYYLRQALMEYQDGEWVFIGENTP